MWRRLSAFFDGARAIGFSFSMHTSTLRGCSTKLDRLNFSGLVFRTAQRLILMVALTPRFVNVSRELPLVVRANAGLRSTRVLGVTKVL